MVGMAGERGVVHLGHLRVTGQVVHHLQGVGGVALDAQGQRLQALQEDETAHRGKRRAGVPEQDRPGTGDVGGRADDIGKDNPVVAVVRLGELRELSGSFPVELAGVHDDTADGGSVTADELGRGVHDDVGAVFNGPEKIGCGKSIVDDERNLVCMGNGRNRLNVNEVGVRVAERLDEDGLRLGTDGVLEVAEVGRVHEGGRDAVGHQRVLEQIVGAAIDGLGRDDMVSRTGDVQDGVGDRRGAGGDGKSTHTPLEGGDTALEDVLRRVRQTAVDIARVCQSETGRRVRGVMEDVRRRLINGDGACVGCGIGLFLAHVELQGFEVEFLGAHICSFYIVFCLQSYSTQIYRTRTLEN